MGPPLPLPPPCNTLTEPLDTLRIDGEAARPIRTTPVPVVSEQERRRTKLQAEMEAKKAKRRPQWAVAAMLVKCTHSTIIEVNESKREVLTMAILTVRNVPDEVHRALRMRAAVHGRSTEAEIREISRKVR